MVPRDAHLPERPTVPLPRSQPVPRVSEPVRLPARTAFLPRSNALSAPPDAGALLRALQRRWLLVFALILVLAPAAAAGAWTLLAARYTAYAQLRIRSTPPKVIKLSADTETGRSEFPIYQKLQATNLRSRLVLTSALAADEVKKLDFVRQVPDPLGWLEDELRLEFQDGNEIMTVLLSGADPSAVVVIVDAIVRSYQQHVVETERARRQDRLKEVEGLYTKADKQLREDREKINKLADNLETSDPRVLTQRHMGLLNDLEHLKRDYRSKQSELKVAQRKLEGQKALLKAAARIPPPVTPSSPMEEGLEPELPTLQEVLSADSTYRQILQRVGRYNDAVASFSQQAVQQDEPALVRARGLLKNAKADQAQRRLEIEQEYLASVQRFQARRESRLAAKTPAPAPPGTVPPEADPEVVKMKEEISFLEAEEKEMASRLNDLESKARKIGTSSTDLEMLQGQIERERSTAEKLWHEMETLRTELGVEARVSVHQPAALQKKDAKRQLAGTAVAPLLVIACVAMGVALLEFRARRIHNAGELVTGLGIPVLGSVPPLSRQLSQAGRDGAVESIAALRTLLLREAETTRVVMVTSAVAGEGKTTLASSLADSLARAGRRTLLIDCDLRAPAAHQLFERPLQPGFSEAVLHEVPLGEAIQETPVPGLSLMAAGQWDREVMQALAREGLPEIFENLKEEYDFIVLDSHPVLAATDSLLLGQHVDGVLLSILRDVSRLPNVYSACQKMTSLGVRVLGAVVNGAAPNDIFAHGYAPPTPLPTRTVVAS